MTVPRPRVYSPWIISCAASCHAHHTTVPDTLIWQYLPDLKQALVGRRPSIGEGGKIVNQELAFGLSRHCFTAFPGCAQPVGSLSCTNGPRQHGGLPMLCPGVGPLPAGITEANDFFRAPGFIKTFFIEYRSFFASAFRIRDRSICLSQQVLLIISTRH
jgi:hypothetical protein